MAAKTKFVPPASSVTTIGCVVLVVCIIGKGIYKFYKKQHHRIFKI
jgi:hypothetical protein